MDRVVLSGHSAGGHLVGAIFAAPSEAMEFDPARIAGGVPISGVFDFEPLLLHSFNSDFRLDEGQVRRLNLFDKRATLRAPMVVAAGAGESSEFRRQSRCLADAWSTQVKALLLLPGLNHFTVLDAFAERGQPLFDATLNLVG
jgi:arylformamidase